MTDIDPRLRLLSYNIRKGKGASGKRIALEAMAEPLRERSPDILLCQEVFHSSTDSDESQSKQLGGLLDMDPVYEPNAIYRRGHHGNAILSRHPVETIAHHDLSTNPIEKRGVLYAAIRFSDRLVHIFNTHLGLNGVQRRKQVARIADHLLDRCGPDDPVVLAGDFNDWTGGLHSIVMQRCGLRSALDGLSRPERRSWPAPRPRLGLDRIYIRNLEVTGVRVLRDAPWNWLSDHLPVEAELSLKTDRDSAR